MAVDQQPQQGAQVPEPMQAEIIRLLEDAVKAGASDVHIAIENKRAVVQFRVHGVVIEFSQMEPGMCQELMQAVFNMSDTSDATYNAFGYSSGRISQGALKLPQQVETVRLQFNPLANYGRYLVMRLLYRSPPFGARDLSRFGFTKYQQRQMRRLRATPTGLIILAGPTGSGKSTSTRINLEMLFQERRGEQTVLSVEDPPEAPIRGVRQIPVTSARGAEDRRTKFDEAIIAALRSDPDVIMIGEIRDYESGNLATQAAMTGHQVWSTLHALDAMSIPNRLRDLGIDPYKIYDPSIMTGMWAQRLVKKLCPHCRIPFKQAVAEGKYDPDFVNMVTTILNPNEYELYARGPGCVKCTRGVTGRIPVAEIIMPDQRLMNYLRDGDTGTARAYWTQKLSGFTMHDHALTHVARGIIAPEEYEALLGPMRPPSNPAFIAKLKKTKGTPDAKPAAEKAAEQADSDGEAVTEPAE
ncbi:MAG: Flp pilus assembly complex ATPase component TadA [Alphaproteobacteria bacterium]|nr:Flp pilus assembly complex ATPase component TadA [Alphaproteobacteria bacterium SS10]